MTPSAEILCRLAALSPELAELMANAVRDVAGRTSDGTITVSAMMAMTGQSPEFIQKVLVVLLFANVLRARFVPYHRSCDLQIGPDEADVDTINLKADEGEYPSICRNCHHNFDGSSDVITRILFSLPPGRS